MSFTDQETAFPHPDCRALYDRRRLRLTERGLQLVLALLLGAGTSEAKNFQLRGKNELCGGIGFAAGLAGGCWQPPPPVTAMASAATVSFRVR